MAISLLISRTTLPQILACCISALGCVLAFSAQGQDSRFQRVLEGSEQRKRHASALNAVAQDADGFMWFGGENGLARFDGRRFRQLELSSGLPSHFVWDMILDRQDTLWIGTDAGLCRYRPITERCRPHLELADTAVTSLATDANGQLIVGTEDGIRILDTTGRIEHSIPLGSDGHNPTFVQDVFSDSKNRIWAATKERGLYLVDSRDGQVIRHFQADERKTAALKSNNVRSVAEDQLGRIWVGTYGGGLSRLRENERDFTHVLNPRRKRSHGLDSDFIRDLYSDSQGQLWVGMNQGGLMQYDPVSDQFRPHRHSPYNVKSLASDQVRRIFEDRQQNLWISTFPDGINFVDRSHDAVTNFTHRPDDPTSLSHKAVLSFLRSQDGLVWVGTEDGLNLFDPERQQVIRHLLKAADEHGLQANAVLSLEEDHNGDIWVGTWLGGLHRLDRSSGTFHHYPGNSSAPGKLNSQFIWEIYRDSSNTVWIGTETGGLSRYDEARDRFVSYTHDANNPNSISSDFVWQVLEDSRGQLWVATTAGLDRFDPATGHFIHQSDPNDPRKLPSRRIRALLEHSSGQMYIGTQDSGVYVMSASGDGFRHIDTGLMPSAAVASLVEDNQGFVWIATANGMARLDPESGEIRSFSTLHGLVGDNFNRNASFKDHQGRLYIGGTEGFSVFDPRVLAVPPAKSPLVINELRIFNREVGIGGELSPLDRAIQHTSHLTLSHADTMFSLGFASLDYRSLQRNRYAYTLEGFDKNWHDIGDPNSATFTNLSAGDYIFRVRSANRDGVWSDDIAELPITVLPAPWYSWWAGLLYLAGFLFLVALVVRIIRKQIELNEEKGLNAEMIRTNRVKDALLMNTSQALRLSVGQMIRQGENVLERNRQQMDEYSREELQALITQGKRISRLINDIAEYSEFSHTRLRVQPIPVELRALAESVLGFLRPLTYSKSLVLVNAIPMKGMRVLADPRYIEQVLNNLIGNAIEFTEAGQICISAWPEQDKINVEISDTGSGISEDQLEDLFSESLQSDEASRLSETGIGLAACRHLIELHGGTLSIASRIDVQGATTGHPENCTVFRFSLPVAASQGEERVHMPYIAHSPQVTPSPLPPAPPPEPPAPARPKGRTILIVDDDPVNRMVLSGILVLHGYAVEEAGSGAEALALVSSGERRVDLVILDIMMPQMTGYETCRRLRQKFSKTLLPVVFLTAKSTPQDVEQGMQVGGNDVLFKPVSKDSLLPRVERFIGEPESATHAG